MKREKLLLLIFIALPIYLIVKYATTSTMDSDSSKDVIAVPIVITRYQEHMYFAVVPRSASGCELFFDKWIFKSDSREYGPDENARFLVEGEELGGGLGFDGLTEGRYRYDDFAYVAYTVLSPCSRITGTLAFDDRTESRSSSYLIIYEDYEEIYRSEALDEFLNRIDIDVAINQNAKTIAFRFETTTPEGQPVAKIVLADLLGYVHAGE